MVRYTVSFLFNGDLSKVLLIHKLTPEWQKGMVNGLGGKFEAGEDCFRCISREVEEEAGLRTNPSEWKKIGELYSDRWIVDVMTIVYKGKETDAKSVERQRVEWFSVSNLPDNLISNLTWLVPLCLDVVQGKEIDLITVKYTSVVKN